MSLNKSFQKLQFKSLLKLELKSHSESTLNAKSYSQSNSKNKSDLKSNLGFKSETKASHSVTTLINALTLNFPYILL